MGNKDLEELLEVLNNFTTNGKDVKHSFKPITLWLPEDYKIRYDDLQKKSSRRFCKKLRELVLIAIDKTDSKKTA